MYIHKKYYNNTNSIKIQSIFRMYIYKKNYTKIQKYIKKYNSKLLQIITIQKLYKKHFKHNNYSPKQKKILNKFYDIINTYKNNTTCANKLYKLLNKYYFSFELNDDIYFFINDKINELLS